MIGKQLAGFRRDQQLEWRLLNCLQGGNLIMENFIKLLGVAIGPVPTAAVYFPLGHYPILLLNEDFINRYCQRDEHLRLLVEHELWHIILAHRSLSLGNSLEHGLCTDAIINSILMRQYVDRPEYMGFLDEVNLVDRWPDLLLRPVPGWPDQPDYSVVERIGPPGAVQVMQQLYPSASEIASVPLPLYSDILDLIRQSSPESDASGSGDSDTRGTQASSSMPPNTSDDSSDYNSPVFLGNHDPDRDTTSQLSQAMQDMIADSLESMASDLRQIGLAAGSAMQQLRNVTSTIKDPARDAKRFFARILRQAVYGQSGKLHRRQRTLVETDLGRSLIPNVRDRYSIAYNEMHLPKLMFAESIQVPNRIRSASTVLCYLDVSSSMRPVLGQLLGLFLPYLRRREIILYGFSTLVKGPYDANAILEKQIFTSGGTDISCVLEHSFMQPAIRRMLIVTDGQTGIANPELVRRLQERRVSIWAVLAGADTENHQLHGIATHIYILPAIDLPSDIWR